MARRKQPEPAGGLHFVGGALRLIGTTISRHPSIAGGIVAVGVTFTYVTMNAMYQPSKHPSPWFATRDQPRNAVASRPETVPVPESRVTTFKIERSDPQSTASIPEDVASIRNDTVFQMQQALRRAGIYAGTADGVMGPQTRKAIQFYQIQAGMEPTGEPDGELLVHLLIANLDSVVVPQSRPTVREPDAATSPIWSRSQEVAAGQQSQPKSPAPGVEPDLVVDIQRGLSNIAYADIVVDGIVGERTRTAIVHFQKHYRLPVTGQPDAAVLAKLKEIGAL